MYTVYRSHDFISLCSRQPAPANAKRDTFSTSNGRGSSHQNGRGRGIVDRGGPANRSRGGAAPARGRGTGRPARDRATKTVEDLDKELEEFMAGNSTADVSYHSDLHRQDWALFTLILCTADSRN